MINDDFGFLCRKKVYMERRVSYRSGIIK